MKGLDATSSSYPRSRLVAVADVLCPVVVGRVHELEVLGALLDAARGGTGSVVVLLGEAGIGKSRLARELVTVASAADMVVLRGRAVPGVVKVPFRPLAEALAPLADDLAASAASAGAAGAALEAWLPVLAAVVP